MSTRKKPRQKMSPVEIELRARIATLEIGFGALASLITVTASATGDHRTKELLWGIFRQNSDLVIANADPDVAPVLAQFVEMILNPPGAATELATAPVAGSA